MAINKEIWIEVQGYYEAGLSLSKISNRTGVDKSTISKKAKIQQWQHGKNIDYIEAKELIAVKKSTENQQLLNCADEIASDNILHTKLINSNATKLANKLALMTDQVEDAQDLRHLVEANDKLSITLKVSDRHAKNTTAIQINSDEKKVVRSGVGDLYKVIRGEEDDR